MMDRNIVDGVELDEVKQSLCKANTNVVNNKSMAHALVVSGDALIHIMNCDELKEQMF